MCNKIIDDDEIEALQVNLIRSHAAGLGDPIKPYIAKAILTIRLNTLVKGYSGVRIELLELMRDMINKGVVPCIQEKGSLGVSGDLSPLSQFAEVAIGEGRAYYRGELMSGAEAMKKAGVWRIWWKTRTLPRMRNVKR